MDRNLFNLQKLKARTKTQCSWFLELQYADDCALVSHTCEGLQEGISKAAALYAKFGLEINIRKTEVLHWSGGNSTELDAELEINGTPLETATSFKYLGSWISNDAKIDDEINNRICQASRSFGRLQIRVFRNHNLKLKTKIEVYTAICLSTLLYGSESWTLYARHLKLLEAWHIKSLRCMLGDTWRDRLTHEEIFRRTDSTSQESYFGNRQLRWVGHVIRMELSKQILYGEPSSGKRIAVDQKKCYKDYLKSVLKKFEIKVKWVVYPRIICCGS